MTSTQLQRQIWQIANDVCGSVDGDDSVNDAIKTKGYFIYPSQLFVNIIAIEASTNGYPSKPDIKGLFADFDTTIVAEIET